MPAIFAEQTSQVVICGWPGADLLLKPGSAVMRGGFGGTQCPTADAAFWSEASTAGAEVERKERPAW